MLSIPSVSYPNSYLAFGLISWWDCSYILKIMLLYRTLCLLGGVGHYQHQNTRQSMKLSYRKCFAQ